MSGLLGFTLADLAGAVDSRKRDYANLIRGLLTMPGETLAQLAAQNSENVKDRSRQVQETRSVMPEVSEPARRAAFDEAMNVGLLGLTAYHGSPHQFDKFDMSAPKTTGGGFNKYGVSLSTDKNVANRYAKDFSDGNGYLYDVDLPDSAKKLSMSAVDFEKLQGLVNKLDSGKTLSELDDVSLEMIASKYGFKYVEHPIDAIKNAGFDVIEKDAGRYGMAEKELLVFDPATLKILDKKRVSK